MLSIIIVTICEITERHRNIFYNPAHVGGGGEGGFAGYRKDMEGVSAANDTLERLVLP